GALAAQAVGAVADGADVGVDRRARARIADRRRRAAVGRVGRPGADERDQLAHVVVRERPAVRLIPGGHLRAGHARADQAENGAIVGGAQELLVVERRPDVALAAFAVARLTVLREQRLPGAHGQGLVVRLVAGDAR